MTEFKLANYMEYDFSKHKVDEFENKIIKSRQSFFVGAGGFIGFNGISRNIVYEQNGDKYRESTQAKFNSNRFIYGIGAYIGYKDVSLKAQYNLNKVFKNSFADQNVLNVSVVFEIL